MQQFVIGDSKHLDLILYFNFSVKNMVCCALYKQYQQRVYWSMQGKSKSWDWLGDPIKFGKKD